MFGHADWHKQVPRDPVKNVRFRLQLYEDARDNRELQCGIREFCRQDILFYTNAFIWQINPRKVEQELGPFITWGFQEDAILRTLHRLYDERRDALWEKSREMGATWMALIIKDWLCRFHDWKKALAISHTADAVDRPGDPDSLFWKVSFINERLPDWLSKGFRHRKLSFSYDATRSAFQGAATTERAGVGGRATSLLLDEFSKQGADREIYGQTKDTGPRLIIGTHYGIEGQFYDLTRREDMFKIQLHWTQHPDKKIGLYRSGVGKHGYEIIDTAYQFPDDYQFVRDGSPLGGPYPGLRSPWYDLECIDRADSRQVAMHLDINPQGSKSQAFDPAYIRMLIERDGREPYWQGDIIYDQDTAQPIALLPRPKGFLLLWMIFDRNERPPQTQYVAGADIAKGTGATPSCFTIVDVSTGEKVLEYANPFIKPEEFAHLAVALCRLFKNEYGEGALFAWEMQGPGLEFGQKVVELGYRNIHCRTNEFQMGAVQSDTPGWYPSPKNMTLLIDEYRTALHKGQFTNHSIPALEQTLEFIVLPSGATEHGGVRSTNDPTGARENHGDRVIADGLAWKMAKTFGTVSAKKKEAEELSVNSLGWRRKMAEMTEKRREW